MSTNLYAQKVSSEHPLILWPFDDQTNYLSYLTDNERNFTNWDFTPVFTINNIIDSDIKNSSVFPNSPISKIVNNNKISYFNSFLAGVYNHGALNYDLWTISMGLYVYLDFELNAPSDTTISIGYTYGGVKQEKTFLIEESKSWVFISTTFSYPDYYAGSQEIDFSVSLNGLPTSEVTSFYLNGLTFGQWAEEYNSSSLGTTVYPGTSFGPLIPESLQNLEVVRGVPYGYDSANSVTITQKEEELAYYLIEDNKLLARNASIPMVFGSTSVTTISPSPTFGPSMILPGKGFLNTSGKKKTYTVEMWLRVNPDTVDAKRIFGPVGSDDGIYVEGPFISIKVGKYTGSHYIGEWYRPMLVQFKYREDATILSINGQEVIFLHFEQDPITQEYNIDFPENQINGYANDILAFYAYPDVPQIDIDCVGIYPYDVPNVVAKRRWMYGQAVEFPETLNASYGGSTAIVDYQFANYLNNYNYPGIGKWEQGINDNAIVVRNTLSSPDYSAPSLFFDNKTEADWYSAMSDLGTNSITLKPTAAWSDVNGYLYFDNFNKLDNLIHGIYGVFEVPLTFSGTQTIFKIEDDLSNNYFLVKLVLENGKIRTHYQINYNDILSTIYISSNVVNTGTEINIGVNLPTIIQNFLVNGESFLGNTSRLRLYVGGDRSFTNTFSGKINTLSIFSANTFQDVSSLFTYYGLIDSEDLVYDGGVPVTDIWDFIANGGNPETIHVFNPNEYYSPVTVYNGGTPFTDIWDSIIDGGEITLETLYDGGFAATSSWSSTIDAGNASTSSWEETIDGSAITSTGTYIDAGGVDTLGESAYSIVLSDNISAYTIIPKNKFGIFKINVGAKSYWEDYVPISLLGKKTSTGYDIDFIQLNVDYPKPLFTQNKYLNTNKSLLKMFVTFEYLVDQRERKPLANYTNTDFANSEGIVIPGEDWLDTKYEVTDDTIIYLPQNLSYIDDLAIKLHIQFTSKNITEQKIKIKSLQLASKAINSNKETEVKTKFGKSLYMYELEDGSVPETTIHKPSLISKKSTPYIYLTRSSGIKTTSSLDENEDAGFYFPINESLNPDYYLNSMMLSMRFDNTLFSNSPVQIFELESPSTTIKFYAEPTTPTNNRVKIYARVNNALYSNIYFFVNGIKTPTPTININEWNMLSFAFASPIQMTSSGKFKVKYPMVVHQISAYQKLNTVNGNAIDLGLANYYGISASELHGSYVGTNIISIKDNSTLLLYDFNRSYYQNVSVTTKTANPA